MIAWLKARLSGRVRPTVRLRLALLSAGLAVLAGALVLGGTYLLVTRPVVLERTAGTGAATVRFLVRGTIPPSVAALIKESMAALQSGRPSAAGGPGLFYQVSRLQRAADLQQVLTRGGVALAILAVLALGAVWWVAGRILRPLQVMTRRARDLSGQTPLGRIGLAGPDDEIKALADTFDDLLARLDAALAAERRFVANASHELRTPLAIQETLLDVGLGDPAADVASLREMAGRLRQVNDRSKRLIDDLLTLARSQQGLDTTEPVDLADVAHDALEAADVGSLRVERDLGPAPIRGNQVLMDRLAANLVENAVRYNVPGGWIRVRTAAEDGRAVLTVVNSGPVAAKADLAGLFEPFRRGVRDRTQSQRGAGLGLSIVRAVAAAHAGTAAAEARPEGGLVLTVTLPLAPDAAEPGRAPISGGYSCKDRGANPGAR